MFQYLKPSFVLLVSILLFSSCEKEEPIVPSLLASHYTVEYSNSIGLPVAGATGIASDGTNFWVISGQYNGDEHTLTQYDPVNFTILNQFTYPNLIETLGTGVFGIAWDGANVWVRVSGQTEKVVKIDPQTGDIVQVWGNSSIAHGDLTWDGDKIWVSSANSGIYTLDPTSGGTQLILSPGYNRGSGVAFRNDELWTVDSENNNVHIYSSIDGTYHGEIKNALVNNGQLCFHQGQLAVLSNGGIKFYDVFE